MKPELEDEAAPNETGVPSLQRAPRSNPSCPGIFEHPADFCRRANGLFPNRSPIAHELQSLAPLSLGWAGSIAVTADKTWCFLLHALNWRSHGSFADGALPWQPLPCFSDSSYSTSG